MQPLGDQVDPHFDRYVVEALVAEGPAVTVWRAMQPELGRRVAIKALSPRLSTDEKAVVSLRTEARRLTGLESPHIVAVYDFVDDADPAYLVTEWVDGETLRELLERSGTLSPEQSLGVLRGALLGLDHAHQRLMVHGDISPGNLIIDTSGTTKLIDFGLAVPVGETGVSGTPAYLSPEVASGLPLQAASDVYSAAAVLFQLLSGRPVFDAGDAMSVIRAHREVPAPALEDHGPKLESLMKRALDKDPSLRPPDAGAFLADLETAAVERYGADWLSRASVASLIGVVGVSAVGGTAATVAVTSAASTSAAATTTAEALATSAAADTGAAIPAAAGAPLAHAAPAAKSVGIFGKITHAVALHPVVTGVAAVVIVAGGVTTAVVATSSSKPKPPPEAVLLASSPQGKFVLSGIAVSEATAKQKATRSKLGPSTVSITQKCGPKSCVSVLIEGKTKRPFTYDGTYFVSSTNTTQRVLCRDKKTGKTTPGDNALLHEKRDWRLKVTKRAPDTADGPGRALELAGTETLTQTASDFHGRCVDGGTLVYHDTWTAKAS